MHLENLLLLIIRSKLKLEQVFLIKKRVLQKQFTYHYTITDSYIDTIIYSSCYSFIERVQV